MRRSFIYLLAIAALALSACATKEDPGKENQEPVNTDPAQLTILSEQVPLIPDDGGSFTVEFSANYDWTVTPVAKWVSVEPLSGEAGENCSVTVKVFDNKTYNERTSRITLSCGEGENKASADVQFTQKHKGALILSDSEVFVDAAGETITVTVKTTSDLQVSIASNAASWITQLRSRSIVEKELTFQIAANSGYDSREGVITFTNESGTDKLTVKQAAKGALIISDSVFNVPSEGQIISVKVSANSDLTFEVEDAAQDWITPLRTRGLVETIRQFSVAANDSYDTREGRITVSNAAGSQVVTVKQGAKGALIIEQKEYNVGSAGSTISVSVQANSTVSFEIAQAAKTWITHTSTRGLSENVFEFTVAANEAYDPREGTITFTNEAGSEMITVTQAANGALFVDPVSFDVDYKGEEISITVQSTSTVTVTVAPAAEGWIIPLRTRGLSTNTYDFSIQANATFDARSGEILFSSADGDKSVTVNQAGSPSVVVVEIADAAQFIDFIGKHNAGDYADVPSLQVKLLDDISFSASETEAFNNAHGISAFGGVFDGNGKKISDLAATTPLFQSITANGDVKDLTLDSSCSFTFTHPNAEEAHFGALAASHEGLIEGVTVNADITLSAGEEVQHLTALGGLAGLATSGRFTNCSYGGLISVAPEFVVNASDSDPSFRKLFIGGLVGWYYGSGSISSSFFKGAILNEAKITSTDKTNPYLVIGGVVGELDGGASISGTNSTADHTEIATGYSASHLGRIVVNTNISYNSAIGGIVGELNNGSVTNCSNAANIACYIIKPGDSSARYLKSGGIAGKVNDGGTITGCTNNGQISHRANPRLQNLGGIAAYNAGTISNCTNNAGIGHSTSGASGISNKGGRVVNIAGIIGENASSAVVSDVHNTGNLEISAVEDNYDTDNDKPLCEIRMGGVVAYNLADIDGSAARNITNSGQVYLNTSPQNRFIGIELGGVVGYSEKSVKNVVNTGLVQNKINQAYALTNLYMGGVIGQMKNGADAQISGCRNSGEVYMNVNKQNAGHNGDYLGGIAAYLSGDANISVSDCENSGYVHIYCNSTTATSNLIVGGVIGNMAASGSVVSCSNVGGDEKAGEVEIAFSDAIHTDNYAGGILGKTLKAVALTDCVNSGYIHGGNSTAHNGATMFTGGIVAYLAGASSITNCDNSGVVYNNQRNNTDTNVGSTYCGGVAGYVLGDAASPIAISGSDNTAEGMYSRRGWLGGVVGYAENANISNCTFNKDITRTSLSRGLGGIVAYGTNVNITNCTFSGSELSATQVQANRAGGIAGRLDGGTVDGCYSHVTTLQNEPTTGTVQNVAGGAIVGISGDGNTIKNCHYKPTINGTASNIAGTGSFSDGGGNVADL